jgi:ribose-phosphate pyrophosphokinase
MDHDVYERKSGLERLSLFALNSSRDFGEAVARCLGISLSRHEERDFEDGEHKSRPLQSVRNQDVFVVQSLYGDEQQSVNDKLCRLIFFIGALRDAAADRVTAVLPYLCYARKDRKTKSRDPVTIRYVAQLLESVGAYRVVTLEVHNLAAFQNAFRCRTEHLHATRLFVEHFCNILAGQDVVVVSPDVGGIKRAESFREALERRLGRPVESAFAEKQRSEGVIRGEAVVGNIKGRAAILLDDLISTGGTMSRVAAACKRMGASRIFAVASHGLLTGQAAPFLADESLEQIVLTNTIPPFRMDPELVRKKITLLDVSALFADAIRFIHSGDSVTELLEPR